MCSSRHKHGAPRLQPLAPEHPLLLPSRPTQVEYDMLDIDEQLFVEDYGQFKRVVQDLERRLASVIMQVWSWGLVVWSAWEGRQAAVWG